MKPLNENVLSCFKASALSRTDNWGRDMGVDQSSQATLMHDSKKTYTVWAVIFSNDQ